MWTWDIQLTGEMPVKYQWPPGFKQVKSDSHIPCGSCGPWRQMPRGRVVRHPHVPYEVIWTLCDGEAP